MPFLLRKGTEFLIVEFSTVNTNNVFSNFAQNSEGKSIKRQYHTQPRDLHLKAEGVGFINSSFFQPGY